jgi:uncharacterized damage-inducible protein DinB
MREVLDRVDPETAAARPIPDAHTIRELVVHVIVWQKEAMDRLAGRGRDDLPPEEDWPDGETAWNELLDELDASHEALVQAVAALDDGDLDRAVPGKPGTVYHLLHGVVQHNLYHAGQIALLAKAR